MNDIQNALTDSDQSSRIQSQLTYCETNQFQPVRIPSETRDFENFFKKNNNKILRFYSRQDVLQKKPTSIFILQISFFVSMPCYID